jgi:Uri superfamily endonuclease
MATAETPLVVLGGTSQSGSYVLRIAVCEELGVPFGRFRAGREIVVPAGECVYVGSALGRRGSVSLGRRLVRHATRTAGKPPHAIRSHMLDVFARVGLGGADLLPRRPKTLFWNVDHLLDREEAEIAGVIAVRSEQRMEKVLGQLLEHDPRMSVIERGLGANDVPGNTHILRVEANEAWWRALPERVRALVG